MGLHQVVIVIVLAVAVIGVVGLLARLFFVSAKRSPHRSGDQPRIERVQPVGLPTTIEGVIARMREIDAQLSPNDGVGLFNQMYLTVTERIAAIVSRPVEASGPRSPIFRHTQTMAELDVRFAGLWLTAVDADSAGGVISPAWRPLFEARAGGRLPVQYAVAGMNTHIEHDLPIAVFDICLAQGLEPADIRADYDAVNDVLAQVESSIRRSFLDTLGRDVDDRLGPVVHLVSTWNIDSARELSWVTAETLWALRHDGFLRDRFLDGLAHTVGMTSRALLTPTTTLPPGSWKLDLSL